MKPEISPLELDLILFFYTFADQYGKVSVDRARAFVEKRWGITLPNKPITISQIHLDVLVEHNLIPDINLIIERAKKTRSKKK